MNSFVIVRHKYHMSYLYLYLMNNRLCVFFSLKTDIYDGFFNLRVYLARTEYVLISYLCNISTNKVILNEKLIKL